MAIQDVTVPLIFGGGYVKRFTTTLGWNNSPSSIEVELVEGTGLVDTISQAANIDVNNLNPGTVTGIQQGSLKFMGLIESWTENWGRQGHTYSVRLVDPRVMFSNVYLSIDGCGPTGSQRVSNLLNAVEYYGDPVSADSNERGMSFNKIRQFLESPSGEINAYGQTLKLNFGSSLFASGNGVPDFYRIEGGVITLDQLLQKVATDFNFDYFAHINYDNYNFDSSISDIDVETVNRSQPSSTGLLTFLLQSQEDAGTLMGYKFGRELRSDPVGTVLQGSKKAFWQGVNTSSTTVTPVWGRSPSGTWIYNTTQSANGNYPIILENIVGSGASALSNFILRVQYPETNLIITDDSVYPPEVTKVSSTKTATGYYATENVLRAALYNQPSWEAMMRKEASTTANLLGIDGDIVIPRSQFDGLDENIKYAARLRNTNSRLVRDDGENELINAVYQVTRQIAEENYGKRFRVQLPDSDWIRSGVYDGSLNPRIEYSIGEAAFANGAGDGVIYPDDVDNHELLARSNNPTFKDDLGRLRSFCSITDYDDDNNSIGSEIDLRVIPRTQYLIEQGDKLVVPITVEQDQKNPNFAIITFNVDIQGKPALAGDQGSFYDFLRAMDYTDSDIENYGLLSNGDNYDFGLVPKRLTTIDSTVQNNGINIALSSNQERYGPFTVTGSVPGPVSYVVDESLNPWSYGNFDTFNTAGAELASGQVSTGFIIDSLDFTLAGLPAYNIGESVLGSNSNVTSINLQFGTDGLTTNYQLRTFALPKNRVTKTLNDRIIRVYNSLNETNRDIIELDNKIQRKEEQEKVNTVEKARESSDNRDRGSLQDDGYLVYYQPPLPGGEFDPNDDNPIPLRS